MTNVKRRKAVMRRRLYSKPGTVIDAHTHVGISPAGYQKGSLPYALSTEDLMIRMDLNGIDMAVVFPYGYTEYYSLPDRIRGVFRRNRKSESTCPYELENRRLCLEVYKLLPEIGRRMIPFAYFDPSRHARAQAEALDRHVQQFPVYGLKTVTSYVQSHITDLLGRGKGILDVASRHDLPVTIHSSVMPGDPWANVFSILKVVRARPDVRFALAHSCRFDRRALDQAAELDNCFVDLSAFYIHCLLVRRNRPAVAAKKYRFRANYRDPASAMRKLAEAYPDTIIWGTDMPANRWTGSFTDDKGKTGYISLPCHHLTEGKIFYKLPAALRRKISYTNTLRYLFGKEPKKSSVRRKK